MKVISSKSITYNEPFSIERIYNFFKQTISSQSTLFFIKDGLFTNVKTLSALVSFFLVLKKGDSFLMIVEGNEADKILEALLS